MKLATMLTATALVMGFGVSTALAQCGAGCSMQASVSEPAVTAQTDSKGVQRVTVVVNNGFSPAKIRVKAGQPVLLTFDTKNKGCASTVTFKGMKITKQLQDGKKTVVEFTPKKAGTITYTCGMNMLKGTIVVE